ncbi:MAG: ribonuclease E [Candidatus Westeberhardia cardiocondylae]|nr:ribonuclease E [Candidatus Westeberhardia cardiocondylae]
MKRMLINANSQEELRIALIDGKKLYDLNIKIPGYEQKKSNIYKGKITRIEPSLEAVFVNYGVEKNGFLPFKEISPEYLPIEYFLHRNKFNIRDILREGQEIIVQINKEEKRNKGAALTTFISLAGSYLVLFPNSANSGGISRRIIGKDRVELKEMLSLLNLPIGMSAIIRTAGLKKNIEVLQRDLSFQLKNWEIIKEISMNCEAPFLIHQESNIIIRAFRDYLRPDISEILIDNTQILTLAKKYITLLGRKDYINKIKFYNSEIPLFSYFQIESQIESVFQREISLPSGSSITIDTTEALTAIDINSAKSTKGSDIEETAFNTNLEATYEIARQLRLRDLSGLVVIDFIDMSPIQHHREIENCLREATKQDRARIQIGKISHFGLLELSRQRINSSIVEFKRNVCPTCKGSGTIQKNTSLSLSILKNINKKILEKNTHVSYIIAPISIISYLLSEEKKITNNTERRYRNKIHAIVDPDNCIKISKYTIFRIKKGEKFSVKNYLSQNFIK